MSEEDLGDETGTSPSLLPILMTEEAIYGLILVSGMIVVAGRGASLEVLLTVVVTVLVFYAAHVYAGAVARLAESRGKASPAGSLAFAARESSGLLVASVVPVVILFLGTSHVIPDVVANWAALIVNTILLAVLGWIAVGRWRPRFTARLLGALIAASFGVILILLKAFVTH
ncbi:MAG: hypothetical protein ACTHNQ_02095 [Microbacterium sp.]|uniref:hypothetical protein n=1 Tax=Microbacterium sp. TaxID=51671 RepID=UPI003F80B761